MDEREKAIVISLSLGRDELTIALTGGIWLLFFLLVRLVPRTSVVVLGEDLLVDFGEHTLLE